jgi:hypothetical protein
MTRKKTIDDYSADELARAQARHHAKKHYRDGMTMTEMELSIWRAFGSGEQASLCMSRILDQLKPEKSTAKLCPRCGRRASVKASGRERTLKSLAGPVTLKRNYHYCEGCQFGFYPLDRLLDLPEEGELTAEMEKRMLDFAVNDVYGECAARWSVHYEEPVSENFFRRVVSRVGAQCEVADPGRLQEQLKPRAEAPAEVLVVEVDGSQLPIRGGEPWKEAKVGLTYRHDPTKNEPLPSTARYVTHVGGMGDFAPLLEEALEVEDIDAAHAVVWVGDGAPCNWTLADQLAADAVQILDWHHAVEHAVTCGKMLLGEESPWLPHWQRRAETLLAEGDPEALIAELMACVPLAGKRRLLGDVTPLEALDNLVRYYRNNAQRMKYRLYREYGYPIGSGAIESAHKHVLQCRMKRAGQHWAMKNARKMARLRAAFRTGGAQSFHSAIRRANWASTIGTRRLRGRRQDFRYARKGTRDWAHARSN